MTDEGGEAVVPVIDWGLLEPLRSGAQAAVVGDDAVLAGMLRAEQALVGAWADLGFAPEAAAEATGQVGVSDLDRSALAAGNRANGNPVIALVAGMRAVVAREPAGAEAVEWLHRGATSQDVVDTALVLVAAEATERIRAALLRCGTRLAELADAHRRTPQVGRTLTQHASPTTFGVTAASWLDGLSSALEVLDATTFPVQLAGSVGNGAAFAVFANDADAPHRLRAAMAARLGLADPGRGWHTERMPVFGIASAAASVAGAVGRIARDLTNLARTEIGEVGESSGGGASSAMPHKSNPVDAVLIVSAAARAGGALATVQSSLLAEDQRPAGAWHAEWQPFRELLGIALETSEALAGLLARLEVDAERMLRTLGASNGLVFAELAGVSLAETLGRQRASALVAEAVRAATTDGVSFDEALRATAGAEGFATEQVLETVFAVSETVVGRARDRFEAVRGSMPTTERDEKRP